MKFNAIIFDLDGTLAYTLEDIANSMNRVLLSKNKPIHNILTYKSFVGKGIRNLVKSALPVDSQDNLFVNECFEMMIEDYRKNCLVKTHLYDGIEKVVNKLIDRKYQLAVFSNKADELTQKIVNALFGVGKFSQIIGSQPSIPNKPDPAGANMIAKKWNIDPTTIAYIGDSGIDMITANQAGMYAIGVLWGYRDLKDLKKGGAKKIIQMPYEILDIITSC